MAIKFIEIVILAQTTKEPVWKPLESMFYDIFSVLLDMHALLKSGNVILPRHQVLPDIFCLGQCMPHEWMYSPCSVCQYRQEVTTSSKQYAVPFYCKFFLSDRVYVYHRSYVNLVHLCCTPKKFRICWTFDPHNYTRNFFYGRQWIATDYDIYIRYSLMLMDSWFCYIHIRKNRTISFKVSCIIIILRWLP